jgi:hypothetical protein
VLLFEGYCIAEAQKFRPVVVVNSWSRDVGQVRSPELLSMLKVLIGGEEVVMSSGESYVWLCSSRRGV